MLDAIVAGLASLATLQAAVFMVIGVVYGLIIGILPGLGGVVAMALLLPFTYGYQPAATLALLLGAHIATVWGDSVTSILFNVPGAAKALPLCFDGYPMTCKGEATRALGASATAALMGGVIVLYGIGITYLALITGMGFVKAFLGSLAFIPGDVLKAVIAALAGRAVMAGYPLLPQRA